MCSSAELSMCGFEIVSLVRDTQYVKRALNVERRANCEIKLWDKQKQQNLKMKIAGRSGQSSGIPHSDIHCRRADDIFLSEHSIFSHRVLTPGNAGANTPPRQLRLPSAQGV